MTIRRQWLLVLTLTAVLAIFVNTLILNSLINRYFQDYTTDKYNQNLTQIQNFVKITLNQRFIDRKQVEVQLESYLDDPITRVVLYRSDGLELADVSSRSDQYEMKGDMNGMMGRMMRHMEGALAQEVDSTQITDSGVVLGSMSITHYSAVGNSLTSTMFKAALVRNSLLSFGIVLLLLVLIGLFVSRRMSRDLTNASSMALQIDLGEPAAFPLSKIREVRIIQQSLEQLQARLKLKQTGRKRLIDEMVHQTRTPLTILRTHLEGMQDGVIDLTPEEMKTCEMQIDNVSSIIVNMSRLLDAEKEDSPVSIEELELGQLLRRILAGLKLQFDQKHIALHLTGSQKLSLRTDPYKLSQCIYNLLTNAYKFTAPDGKVEVSYEAARESLTISIADSGIGISQEDQDHLFDAYYKGSNAQDVPGEGLGLYVVRHNLEQIGGLIGLQSTPGHGSQFVITLPLTLSE